MGGLVRDWYWSIEGILSVGEKPAKLMSQRAGKWIIKLLD